MANRLFLIHNNHVDDPRINLALEEYATGHVDLNHGYLLLYVNRPSVIIGRNQNPLLEVDSAYLAENNMPLVRRISGGGAVYHDHGNLNFSFITRFDPAYLNNYAFFAAPIIAALKGMGVPAALNAGNDIVVDGRKISGISQYSNGKGLLVHGTLLFDARLDVLWNALAPPSDPMASKAVRSLRSPVANIVEFLPSDVSMHAFKSGIRDGVVDAWGGDGSVYRLDGHQWDVVDALARDKYHSWHWNHGRSPRFSLVLPGRSETGPFQVRVVIEKGHIKQVAIRGSFPDPEAIRGLERRLIGCLYRKIDVERVLSGIDPAPCLGGITRKAFVDVLVRE